MHAAHTPRRTQRTVSLLLVALVAVLAAAILPAAGHAATNVSIALDWLPQPSNGGPYAAQSQGYYQHAGLNVKIVPGGTRATSIQTVAAGRATFGLETSDNIIEARAQGIPIVALAATLQKDPAVLLYHKGQDIKTVADLDGRTIYTQIAAPSWIYLKKKYDLDVQDRQFTGSYAAFASDQKAVAQGYATSAPYQLGLQGIQVGELRLPDDYGYGSVLFTTEKELKQHPDQVKAFVKATFDGWSFYHHNVPAVSNLLRKAVSGNRTLADLNHEGEAQKSYIWTGATSTKGWGWQDAARWQAAEQQLIAEGVIKKAVSGTLFTNQYLP